MRRRCLAWWAAPLVLSSCMDAPGLETWTSSDGTCQVVVSHVWPAVRGDYVHDVTVSFGGRSRFLFREQADDRTQISSENYLRDELGHRSIVVGGTCALSCDAGASWTTWRSRGVQSSIGKLRPGAWISLVRFEEAGRARAFVRVSEGEMQFVTHDCGSTWTEVAEGSLVSNPLGDKVMVPVAFWQVKQSACPGVAEGRQAGHFISILSPL